MNWWMRLLLLACGWGSCLGVFPALRAAETNSAGDGTGAPGAAGRRSSDSRRADLSYAVVNGRAITPEDVLDAMCLRYRDQRRTLSAS